MNVSKYVVFLFYVVKSNNIFFFLGFNIINVYIFSHPEMNFILFGDLQNVYISLLNLESIMAHSVKIKISVDF